MNGEMTPMERTLATLQHKEPDRVPFFLNLTMHGARLLGKSIQEYYSSPEYIVKAQLAMQKRYGYDAINAITYSSAEFEAFGGSTIFYEDGPPNSGEPIIQSLSDIESLETPSIQDCKSLMVTLDATRMLKEKVGNEIPIIGLVISPFSLPVMQMGFESYFDLLYSHPEHFKTLMRINEEFENELANMQLEAGAATTVYFDPVSSTTIIPRSKFIETGFEVMRRSVKAIKGGIVAHYASGRVLPIIDKVVESGVIALGVSVDEDLRILKGLAGHKLTLVGNLNALEMPNWSERDAEVNIRTAIEKGGPGGGFILCDNHGEIPYQVPEATLEMMVRIAKRYGNYPLN